MEKKFETIDGIDYDDERSPVPKARYNYLVDDAQRGEDGYWTVLRVAKQAVSYDNKQVYVREVSFKAIDRELSSASRTTHTAMLNLLSDYDNDFWSREEWDGKQYVMIPSEYWETKEGESVLAESNENTKT